MENSQTKCIFNSGSWNYDVCQLSDAKLRTDDGCIFDIHRIILVRSSDYFGALFCGMDRERREFSIPGISGNTLSDILSYIYNGDLQVTEWNLIDLMIAADYLCMKDLCMRIKQSVKSIMTENNCLRILPAAHYIGDKAIFRECFRFIQMRFEGIRQCQGIQGDLADLPLEMLILILSNRSLYVYNETTVWRTIVAWMQKDTPLRMNYVPQLLLTLAKEDIGEELATEILQHEIISKNSLMKDLIEFRSLNDFYRNRNTLLLFMSIYPNNLTVPYNHRIPPKLNVISFYNGDEEHKNSNIYITYDENADLWRKIAQVNFKPDVLIAVGNSIYIFKLRKRICMKFDFSVMNWVTMESFRCSRYEFYVMYDGVVAIGAKIYVFGKISRNIEHCTYNVRVYHIDKNRWFDGVPLPNIRHGCVVAIDKKIYVVGITPNYDGMMTCMFDPVSRQWSNLPPPIVYRFEEWFTLVAHRQKIYLLGGSNLEDGTSNCEVFDPATNHWKEIQNLPYTYSDIMAVVFNDQIIVSDEIERNTKNVRWNDAMECWEKMNSSDTMKDLHRYRFCTVDDIETIKKITKQNRNPNTQMEKSLLN